MRTFAVAGLVLALSVAVLSSPVDSNSENLPKVANYKQGDKCPAPQFYNDCNRCFCQPDGHSAGCTLKACPSQEIVSRSLSDDKVVYAPNHKNGEKCPAKYFTRDNCNTCVCAEDGVNAACTFKLCINDKLEEKTEEVPVVKNYKQGEKCPAPFFKNDCNNCFCLPDGHSAGCTLKACL